MRFEQEDVRRIAVLARLELTDAELDRYAAQLAAVLDHVAALEAAGPAPPAGESADTPPEPRADIVAADPLAFSLTGMAPAFAEGFFTVPRLEAFDADSPAPGPGD